MKKFNEIIKSSDYWLEKFQNEIFRMLSTFMNEERKSQSDVAKDLKVSKSYISQILNGNFNFTLKKLIEISLYVGKVPTIEFVSISKYITNHKREVIKNKFNNVESTSTFIIVNVTRENSITSSSNFQLCATGTLSTNIGMKLKRGIFN